MVVRPEVIRGVDGEDEHVTSPELGAGAYGLGEGRLYNVDRDRIVSDGLASDLGESGVGLDDRERLDITPQRPGIEEPEHEGRVSSADIDNTSRSGGCDQPVQDWSENVNEDAFLPRRGPECEPARGVVGHRRVAQDPAACSTAPGFSIRNGLKLVSRSYTSTPSARLSRATTTYVSGVASAS